MRKNAGIEAIRDAREYSESIVNAVREPLIVLDGDLKVISASRSFYGFFKAKPQETEKRFIYDLGNRQWDMPELRRLLESIIPKSFTFDNFEVEHDFPKIGRKVMLLNARRIYRKSGKKKIMLLAIEDITERKKTEAELQKALEELSKLNMLKSEFVSTVSHELRTPLATMKEFATILLDGIPGALNEQQREYLDIIDGNISRLSRLINNLLDISKIEAHKVELKREPVNIVELAGKTSYNFEPFANSKKLEIRCKFPKNDIQLYVDKDRVNQVFVNLINNALKFTKEGYVEISILDKEKFVECAVSDTGIGISDKDLPRIFSKFAQFGRISGSGEKGTGLGLAISKGIIELHQGKIWVESKLGQGSRFIFTLPKYAPGEFFGEVVVNCLKEAIRADVNLSAIILKVENYGAISKRLGQEAAASVMQNLERLTRANLRRPTDITMKDARTILVMLPGTDSAGASSVLERLKNVFEDYLSRENLETGLEIASSLVSFPEDAATEEEFLKKVPL
jgi:two-component system cell cycle sensor histidine kinase PleC